MSIPLYMQISMYRALISWVENSDCEVNISLGQVLPSRVIQVFPPCDLIQVVFSIGNLHALVHDGHRNHQLQDQTTKTPHQSLYCSFSLEGELHWSAENILVSYELKDHF